MYYLVYIIGFALRWLSNARRREYTDVTTSKTGADLHLYAPRKENSILARRFRLIYCFDDFSRPTASNQRQVSNASPESYLK